MKKTVSGFTIAELLIVIVVVAVLAAITVVAFNGVQNRAYDSAVRSDIVSVGKKMALFRAEYDRYPSVLAEFTSLGLRASSSAYAVNTTVTRNFIVCLTTTADDYTWLFKSRSGAAFSLTGSTGAVQSFGATWVTATTAGSLCDGLDGAGGAYNSTNQAAGYWTGQSPNWASWTGVP